VNKQCDEELKNSKSEAKIFTGNTGLEPVRPAGLQPAKSQTPDRMFGDHTGQSPVFQLLDLTPGVVWWKAFSNVLGRDEPDPRCDENAMSPPIRGGAA
jgi:hypothetical protein